MTQLFFIQIELKYLLIINTLWWTNIAMENGHL